MDQLKLLEEHVRGTSTLITQILKSVQGIIGSALGIVTEDLAKIQGKTFLEAQRAEGSLNQTYFQPSKEQVEAIESIQNDVDSLVDSLTNSTGTSEDGEEISQTGSEFSKSVEAIGFLNEKLSNTLYHLMGTLSNEDVISQRLDNVTKACACIGDQAKHISRDTDMLSFSNELQVILEVTKRSFKTSEEAKCMSSSGLKVESYGKSLEGSIADIWIDFCGKYFEMISKLITDIAELFSSAIEKTNTSVFEMSDIATASVAHAQNKMRKTEDGFQNLKVDNRDARMENLKKVGSVVSDGIFSLMGVLSEVDVGNQRLLVAAKIAKESSDGFKTLDTSFSLDMQLATIRSLLGGNFVTVEDKKLYQDTFGHLNENKAS